VFDAPTVAIGKRIESEGQEKDQRDHNQQRTDPNNPTFQAGFRPQNSANEERVLFHL